MVSTYCCHQHTSAWTICIKYMVLHGHYLTLFSWFSAHGMSAALFKTWIVATASWLEINVYTIWLVYLFFCQIVFGTYRWLDCPVVTWCSFLMMDVKCDLRRLCSFSTVFWPTSIWWRPWWDATFGWVWDFWCNCRCFQLGSALGSSGLSGSRWDTSSPSGYHCRFDLIMFHVFGKWAKVPRFFSDHSRFMWTYLIPSVLWFDCGHHPDSYVHIVLFQFVQ